MKIALALFLFLVACNGTPTVERPQWPLVCQPTSQDNYVYHPSRLQVLSACLRVEGRIEAIRQEADGDLHILVRLDDQYQGLLEQANYDEQHGDLVVEPVCVGQVSQQDAKAICADDHDPLDVSGLRVGARVWMEGRYVLDLQHGGWAELHPLYRFVLLGE